MIIMPRKIFTEKMFDNNLLHKTLLTISESGYSDDVLAYKWLFYFDQESKNTQQGPQRLLLFDGHGSYMTYEFVATCEQMKIIPFCLLAYSTHMTQPLDVVVFQPYKHQYCRAVEDTICLLGRGKDNFTKYSFLKALKQIREKAFIKKTIWSAFCRVGVFSTSEEVLLKALKLVVDKKVRDKEMGGRTYNPDPSDPEGAIWVLASNAP